MRARNRSVVAVVLAFVCQAAVCWAVPAQTISGNITIDGSSTVYPITEAVAEEFRGSYGQVKITVGISGTGGGFKRFCAGETDISDASRPIKSTEMEACQTNGIQYIELPVAYDALSVVVNPKNTWVESMTVAELKKLWEPEAQGKITSWNHIRSTWPDKPIRLFGPGTDSGTFDYFTEAIMGKEDMSRGDFTSSEDDNVLVQGVAGDVGALGYFGMAYYHENQGRLKAVKIDAGSGPVAPTGETVISNQYKPLSRPLFVYVNAKAAKRPEVAKFIDYYLTKGPGMLGEVGYVQLPAQAYTLAQARFQRGVVGSMFAHGAHVGLTIEDLLKRES